MAVIATKLYAKFIIVTNVQGLTTIKRFIAQSHVGPYNLLNVANQ